MRSIITTGFVLLYFISFSQVVSQVDFNDIKKETRNPKSKYYFDSLMVKFHKADTSMHDEEYSYLYYGQVFAPNYRPYFRDENSIDVIEAIRERKFSKAIKIGEKIMKDNPLELTMMYYLSIAYKGDGQDLQSRIYAKKYKSLIKVINGSGDGIDKENALVVARESDEMEVLRDMKLQKISQSHDGEFNLIKLDYPNKEYLKQLYFILPKSVALTSK